MRVSSWLRFTARVRFGKPGWEIGVIRSEMFTWGYGFIVDYLAEILRYLRSQHFSHRPDQYFTISNKISTRDRDAVYRTMSGMLKIIFPNGGETELEVEELLKIAMESRKRVKDQLLRIDNTYPSVDFHFMAADGRKRSITTVEEKEFPQFYHRGLEAAPGEYNGSDETAGQTQDQSVAAPSVSPEPKAARPKEGHVVFAENRKGLSYDKLFGPYLDGAKRIVVTDPYIRIFYQIRNMMELVEMVIRRKAPEDQVLIHLVTGPDERNIERQRELLDSIAEACTGTGVDFT